MKNKMRMIEAAIGLKCVSSFVGPPATLFTALNLFGNPVIANTFLVILHSSNIKGVYYRVRPFFTCRFTEKRSFSVVGKKCVEGDSYNLSTTYQLVVETAEILPTAPTKVALKPS